MRLSMDLNKEFESAFRQATEGISKLIELSAISATAISEIELACGVTSTGITADKTIVALDNQFRGDQRLLRMIVEGGAWGFAVAIYEGRIRLLDIRHLQGSMTDIQNVLMSYQRDRVKGQADAVILVGWSKKRERIIYVGEALRGGAWRSETSVITGEVLIVGDNVDPWQVGEELCLGLIAK